MSEIKVNKVSPATGTAITLGDSGDTFTVPSGATIVNSGTATGFGGGKILQVVNVMNGAVATGTTTFPKDDTIPQNSEGFEVMTLAITPNSATNKLFIEVVIHVGHTTDTAHMQAGLWQDSTANALAVTCWRNVGSSQSLYGASLNHYMTSGTTSSSTFKVRIGSSAGATTTFNGIGGSRFFGGVAASSITITEIEV